MWAVESGMSDNVMSMIVSAEAQAFERVPSKGVDGGEGSEESKPRALQSRARRIGR